MTIHITLVIGKAEYIFSFLISLSMIIVAVKLFIDSILSIINNNKLEFSIWLIVVCIITIITKLCLYIYTKNLYKKYNNILLEANCKDHRNDCIVTTFTLISILLTLVDIFWFDGVVGIGISIWIFYTGLTIFIESYNVLMDKSLDEDTKNKIIEYINKNPDVRGIKQMHTIPTGYKYIAVITIYLDGALKTFESHEIADKIQYDISSNFDDIESVIVHVEPLEIERAK